MATTSNEVTPPSQNADAESTHSTSTAPVASTSTAPSSPTSTVSSSPTPTTAANPNTNVALPAWEAVPAGELSILFVGNSHTFTHGIPGKVEALLESHPGMEVAVRATSASSLGIARDTVGITDEVSSGAWDLVILQGQAISMSHTINYSRKEAEDLVSMAREAGSRVLFFAEWKREGIDETEYIEQIYREIAAVAGAEVIPVGRSWERFLATDPNAQLWSPDGNHSAPDGALLAAAAIAYFLVGPNAELSSDPIEAHLLETARLSIEDYLNQQQIQPPA